ncbi:acyl-CoA N-acyltransferase [Tribonema minus]|uniref:Glycylpeptide N-tetradecanoyltransferase n=1 Tax=Tribonema minus TaxID=303371 RepID=A0A835Z907_9STRA|nr:acyl-CoA N-acyltransferase [Tribonema minus]
MVADPESATALGTAVLGQQPAAAAAGGGKGADVLQYIRQQQLERMMKRNAARLGGESKEHKFWDTQPVPKQGAEEEVVGNGPIEVKQVSDVRPDSYPLPAGFEWCNLDINSETEADEVYTLLWENYVEDDDHLFRFDYSKPFLRWALTPPGYSAALHVGVRSTKTNKLLGFISGVPATMRVSGDAVRTVEINFLCVHKKLRSKRLAPVLIKEVTRRVNLKDIWQAVYTAGVVLPTPVASCRYFHRNLNPKKLIEVGFSRLANRMTLARTMRLYKLPDATATALRPMQPADVPSAHKLVSEYLLRFKLHPLMDVHDFGHWLLPREGVVDSFVLTGEDNTVTDFCSFYHLPSTVIGNEKHRTLFAAYSFYNVATSMPLTALMRDALVLARDRGMDVFNALNLMENEQFLQDLLFGIGDGHLQYYLYNWRCAGMTPGETGLVLL